MAISICKNHDCVHRDICYRYLARPFGMQSYQVCTPENNEFGERFECSNWIAARDKNGNVMMGDCKSCVEHAGQIYPCHNGSSRCGSGSIASGGTKAHCSCDVCF